jgi:hypothetical protein
MTTHSQSYSHSDQDLKNDFGGDELQKHYKMISIDFCLIFTQADRHLSQLIQ